ncbi:uncharacterized protein CTRU02_203968 [Colletotrichum truncatum]|uniref:Uncharacterized protein n=1 Tax=Colletotrichum truncatum TaxID=5467 RepID=A0ACC3ZB28_COLTU|nr:uncharacterized protein CTRU02_15450 [Colletotrichum truncatum]KAF6781049.1 hypothetical protein CTRU02_15450 [Colletotrichum truncatum]
MSSFNHPFASSGYAQPTTNNYFNQGDKYQFGQNQFGQNSQNAWAQQQQANFFAPPQEFVRNAANPFMGAPNGMANFQASGLAPTYNQETKNQANSNGSDAHIDTGPTAQLQLQPDEPEPHNSPGLMNWNLDGNLDFPHENLLNPHHSDEFGAINTNFDDTSNLDGLFVEPPQLQMQHVEAQLSADTSSPDDISLFGDGEAQSTQGDWEEDPMLRQLEEDLEEQFRQEADNETKTNKKQEQVAGRGSIQKAQAKAQPAKAKSKGAGPMPTIALCLPTFKNAVAQEPQQQQQQQQHQQSAGDAMQRAIGAGPAPMSPLWPLLPAEPVPRAPPAPQDNFINNNNNTILGPANEGAKVAKKAAGKNKKQDGSGKRQVAANACARCRRSKIRCAFEDGASACKNCLSRNITQCVRSGDDARTHNTVESRFELALEACINYLAELVFLSVSLVQNSNAAKASKLGVQMGRPVDLASKMVAIAGAEVDLEPMTWYKNQIRRMVHLPAVIRGTKLKESRKEFENLLAKATDYVRILGEVLVRLTHEESYKDGHIISHFFVNEGWSLDRIDRRMQASPVEDTCNLVGNLTNNLTAIFEKVHLGLL